jgi:acyl transferase domain-containing protein
MAVGLYAAEPRFAAAMDEVFALLGPDGPAVRADWLAEHPAVPIDHVTRSQILLFAVDHALGSVLLDRGVDPAVLLGHSIGEVAAAVLAGVLTLPDAVALVWDRIGHLAAAPPGGMLAVAATAEQVEPFTTDEVVIGALNAPRQTVLAGAEAPLQAVTDRLRAAGLTCVRVPASSGFHSPSLAGAAERALDGLWSVPFRVPRRTVVSGYTAAPLTAAEARDPRFWASHPVAPVRFWPALDLTLRSGPALLCETGHGSLMTSARRHPAVRRGDCAVLTLLPPHPASPAAERDHLAAAVDRLLAAAI